MTIEDPPVPVPRLAFDTTRAWIATAVAAVPLAVGLTIIVLHQPELLESENRATVTAIGGYGFWCTYAIVWTALTYWAFRRLDSRDLHRTLLLSTPQKRLEKLEHSLSVGSAPSWGAQVAVLAIFAVVATQFSPELRTNPWVLGSAVLVVATSWLTTALNYALHYARQVAGGDDGLDWPGGTRPVLRDYLYLAVQLSTTFASSDVGVTSTTMRWTVTLHSIIAFVFNSVTVALVVSALVNAAG